MSEQCLLQNTKRATKAVSSEKSCLLTTNGGNRERLRAVMAGGGRATERERATKKEEGVNSPLLLLKRGNHTEAIKPSSPLSFISLFIPLSFELPKVSIWKVPQGQTFNA
ncbi:unnamed protein product [Gadus morhua 'NCC']